MLLWACSSNEPVMSLESDQDLENVSNIRTPEEAIAAAEESYSNFFKTTSRSSISADKKVIAVPSHSFGSARSGKDTVLYIVNFEDNKGFAIVNALRMGTEIIGISDSGNYNTESPDSNPPGLEMFLGQCQNITATYLAAKDKGISGDIGTFYSRSDTLMTDFSEPKVKTIWSQGSFFGKYCPNGIVGCGPLALGMALSAYKQPTAINLDFPDTPTSRITTLWDQIIPLNEYSANNYSQSAKDNVALFLRQIGHIMDAKYNPGVTSTYFDNNNSTAKFLAEGTSLTVSNPTPKAEILNIPKADLKKGVAVVRGVGNFGGHAWVSDGYLDYTIYVTDYFETSAGKISIIGHHETELHYVHMNWGWGGQSNGYFTLDYLLTSSPVIPDNNRPMVSEKYEYDFRYYIISSAGN